MEKSIFFFRRRFGISAGYKRIFLKDLKLSINYNDCPGSEQSILWENLLDRSFPLFYNY